MSYEKYKEYKKKYLDIKYGGNGEFNKLTNRHSDCVNFLNGCEIYTKMHNEPLFTTDIISNTNFFPYKKEGNPFPRCDYLNISTHYGVGFCNAMQKIKDMDTIDNPLYILGVGYSKDAKDKKGKTVEKPTCDFQISITGTKKVEDHNLHDTIFREINEETYLSTIDRFDYDVENDDPFTITSRITNFTYGIKTINKPFDDPNMNNDDCREYINYEKTGRNPKNYKKKRWIPKQCKVEALIYGNLNEFIAIIGGISANYINEDGIDRIVLIPISCINVTTNSTLESSSTKRPTFNRINTNGIPTKIPHILTPSAPTNDGRFSSSSSSLSVPKTRDQVDKGMYEFAQEARRAEQERIAQEEAIRGEQERIAQLEARRAEQERIAQLEARRAEQERIAQEEVKQAEQVRRAEQARIAQEEARRAGQVTPSFSFGSRRRSAQEIIKYND